MKRIALVVEGQGERGAVPILVRDHLAAREKFEVGVAAPLTAKGRGKLMKKGELERFVKLAARDPDVCGVLVVLDAEDDAACELGPACSMRAEEATHIPTRACLAIRMYENWIVGSAETVFPPSSDAGPLTDPEGGGAVREISRALSPTKYNKPIHQPRLTSRMDHSISRSRCRSFDRLLRCIDELVAECEK